MSIATRATLTCSGGYPFVIVAALLAPTLLAYNLSPSATLLNQLLAVAGWGGVLLAGSPRWVRGAWRPAAPLLAALALLMGAVLVSMAGSLPSSLAFESLALLAAAMALVWVSAARGAGPRGEAGEGSAGDAEWHGFASAMVVAGLASTAVALVQVFAPQWADGTWIARSGLPGRAVGNLRQPNHLSSLLLWGLIALVPLMQARRWFAWRLPDAAAALFGAAMVLAVVLSASRTGTVGILLLAVWGALDKRLARRVRWALLVAPLVYALCWFVMDGWAHETAHAFGGEARLHETDLSSSRFGIWRDTLSLIRANPWTGVGWGEFNFAWTLTPFPGRPVAFFDHTHNLFLQFAVELGLPMAVLVCGLLAWALWRAARQAWAVPGDAGAAARAVFVMLLMIGLHSLLEYPLWYAYFLLPTAWAWGSLLRGEPAQRGKLGAERSWAAPLLGLAMIAGAVFALTDYGKVVAIYVAGDNDASLAQRIERGRSSVFFAYQADYAAATTTEPPSQAMGAFATATQSLLDTRLMIAWAHALNESGHPDKARYLADRLREFHNPDAATFLGACATPATPAAPLPFQCTPAPRTLGWRDFRP